MKHLLASGLLGLALWLAPSQASATAFTVDSATVSIADIFHINLNVLNTSGLFDPLTSWQFDLTYNPTILQANLVTEGPFLSSAGTTFFMPGVIDNTTGLSVWHRPPMSISSRQVAAGCWPRYEHAEL